MVVAINDGYIRFRSDLARFRLAMGYIYMSIPISGVLIIIYTIDMVLTELKQPL